MATLASWHIDIRPWAGVSAASGGLAESANTSTLGAGFCGLDVPGVGGFMEWPVVMAAGTWTLTVVHFRNTNRGDYTFLLDGVALSPVISTYAAATANTVDEITGISVASDGTHLLRVTTPTKHASSSAYQIGLQHLTLTRTA